MTVGSDYETQEGTSLRALRDGHGGEEQGPEAMRSVVGLPSLFRNSL